VTPADLRIGVDIGGSFTDHCVADEDGIVGVAKSLTTPSAPAQGVEDVFQFGTLFDRTQPQSGADT